jgi:hypothetical protein
VKWLKMAVTEWCLVCLQVMAPNWVPVTGHLVGGMVHYDRPSALH